MLPYNLIFSWFETRHPRARVGMCVCVCACACAYVWLLSEGLMKEGHDLATSHYSSTIVLKMRINPLKAANNEVSENWKGISEATCWNHILDEPYDWKTRHYYHISNKKRLRLCLGCHEFRVFFLLFPSHTFYVILGVYYFTQYMEAPTLLLTLRSRTG